MPVATRVSALVAPAKGLHFCAVLVTSSSSQSEAKTSPSHRALPLWPGKFDPREHSKDISSRSDRLESLPFPILLASTSLATALPSASHPIPLHPPSIARTDTISLPPRPRPRPPPSSSPDGGLPLGISTFSPGRSKSAQNAKAKLGEKKSQTATQQNQLIISSRV
ncbi:hypothetical protein GJ744_011630 [Endocarpon pusillum]|uniref:Uncharacterized protein n=1 Tax=Endocarpon pusillum TaxID=364733 RepID=A0A8H7E3C0_9EURO|nr:hypothetical protein GJ744_011630 [Endocarpon pusillum]